MEGSGACWGRGVGGYGWGIWGWRYVRGIWGDGVKRLEGRLWDGVGGEGMERERVGGWMFGL